MNPTLKSWFRSLPRAALWPLIIAACLLLLMRFQSAHASKIHYSGRLSPSDYLFGSQEQRGDSIFDQSKAIDLSANIGIGSDCGKINFQTTLQSSLNNVLSGAFFSDLGQDLASKGAMLTLCYMSPTLCAIVKHGQLSANYLSQMRLNQCALIDKYVDSRVEDFYQERQTCVHRAIESNGGNMDAAMESCGKNGIWNTSLTNWAGSRNGEKAGTNRLIDSSAKWAGMNGPASQGTLNLLKSLVGDTVVSQGSVSVEYGPRQAPLTPRTYLQSLEKTTYDKLCKKIMGKLEVSGSYAPVDQIISDSELKDISNNSEQLLIDRQTLRALSYMSPNQKDRACKKLADASAMTLFSNDLNRSLDVLTTLAQNPNLPPQRKLEIEQKRQALKEQIEMTVELRRERSEPLNQVLAQIHEEGSRLQSQSVADDLDTTANAESNHRTDVNFLDCSDGVMCQ